MDIRIAINLSYTGQPLALHGKCSQNIVFVQRFINKQLVEIQILKLCLNYKPVGLNIRISQLKEIFV